MKNTFIDGATENRTHRARRAAEVGAIETGIAELEAATEGGTYAETTPIAEGGDVIPAETTPIAEGGDVMPAGGCTTGMGVAEIVTEHTAGTGITLTKEWLINVHFSECLGPWFYNSKIGKVI